MKSPLFYRWRFLYASKEALPAFRGKADTVHDEKMIYEKVIKYEEELLEIAKNLDEGKRLYRYKKDEEVDRMFLFNETLKMKRKDSRFMLW